MESLPLSFGVLLVYLHQTLAGMADPSQSSNGTRYNLKDAILSAFSVFFMQCESFLEHQRQMQSRQGQDHAQTLFGVGLIPSTPQIRNILDHLGAATLFEVFKRVYRALKQGGSLQPYQCLGGHLLVALDGMGRSILVPRRFIISSVPLEPIKMVALLTFTARFCP